MKVCRFVSAIVRLSMLDVSSDSAVGYFNAEGEDRPGFCLCCAWKCLCSHMFGEFLVLGMMLEFVAFH